jgi:hypothetical protein
MPFKVKSVSYGATALFAFSLRQTVTLRGACPRTD